MTSKQLHIAFILILLLASPLAGGDLLAQKTQFKDLNYPYKVKYHQLKDGKELAYIDEGKGEPLILVHGLGSYIPAWKKNIATLSDRYRVIALDLPGFGKSYKTVDQYSIPFFAETVAGLQESLGIERATWVGHSMGGQISLQAALLYPEKIGKLVLISPAGFEQFSKQEGAMMTKFVTPASVKATPDSMVRKTFQTTFYDFPEEAAFMAEDRVAIRAADDFDRYARAYASSVQAMLEGPVYDQLSGIDQPTLIIFGKQDALIPNKQLHPQMTTRQVAEQGQQQLPNSQLKMINKAGHFVQFEQSSQVNKVILNFLNQ
ncbi:MAG: alpha/beta fold hydrolase [Fodinibius sp.]|nr:alpha/beta fold hydrolase [Fodinibius sp.]